MWVFYIYTFFVKKIKIKLKFINVLTKQFFIFINKNANTQKKYMHTIQQVTNMFLLINSIVASLDGLIIGIGLRLSNVKVNKTNILTILIGNFLIYTLFLTLYYSFQFTFMTKTISTILYLFLAYRSLKEETKKEYQEKLKFWECILLTLSHSLDGTLISLNFVYTEPMIKIVTYFSLSSLLILLIGYYFASVFKNNKKSNYWSAFLFLLLAIINQFL